MDKCLMDKYEEIKSRRKEHMDYGVKGMKWGEHTAEEDKPSAPARPKTKLELIKFNKGQHAKLEKDVAGMKDGIEKDVAKELTSRWLSGHNWLGGLSDSVSNKAYENLMKKGYSFEDIEKEQQRQWGVYG